MPRRRLLFALRARSARASALSRDGDSDEFVEFRPSCASRSRTCASSSVTRASSSAILRSLARCSSRRTLSDPGLEVSSGGHRGCPRSTPPRPPLAAAQHEDVLRTRAELFALPIDTPRVRRSDACVLAVTGDLVRVRLLGDRRECIVCPHNPPDLVPGHLVTLVVDRGWTSEGRAHASGRIEDPRIDAKRPGRHDVEHPHPAQHRGPGGRRDLSRDDRRVALSPHHPRRRAPLRVHGDPLQLEATVASASRPADRVGRSVRRSAPRSPQTPAAMGCPATPWRSRAHR